MPLDNINDVFPNATFNGTNLTIPVADLPKFNTGNDVQEGAELVYALVDQLQSVVSAAGHGSLSAGVSNTFEAAGLEMNRAYTFNAVLDLTSQIDNFDVKPDTSFVAIPDLVLAAVDATPEIVEGDAEVDDAVITELTFTGDGVAIGDVSDYAFAITTSTGANAASMVVEYDGGWKVRSNGGAFDQEVSKTYTITVTTADADDIDPIPAVTATFTLTVTAA